MAAHFVGQEPVTLSTAPVYVDGKLEPRPITLRVYAARTAKGWTIMPGGFARVGSTLDTAAIAMQRGGQAADVWVVSSKPVERVTLLPQEGEKLVRNSSGALPSRAADNLIWLGRYAERCEATVRILRAYNARLAGDVQPRPADPQGHAHLSRNHRCRCEPSRCRRACSPRSTAPCTPPARSATASRPMAGWRSPICARPTRNFAARVQLGDDATRAMTVLLRKLAGFSGLVHENMYRFAGWRFLEIGRRLERGIQIAGITRWLTREEAPDGALDMLLEIGDSVMTHRRRYNVAAGRELLYRSAGARSAQSALGAVPGGRAARADRDACRAASTTVSSRPRPRRCWNCTPNCCVAEPEDMTTERLDRTRRRDRRASPGCIADAYFV